jgi:hypothetical protein
LVTIATSSPQVNQEIYSEEDLLAIDSSPREVIDQLAVETVSDAQGTLLLPPPAFQPTGKRQSMNLFLNYIQTLGDIKVPQTLRNQLGNDGSYSFRYVNSLFWSELSMYAAWVRV